jgi:hypothetical protein
MCAIIQIEVSDEPTSDVIHRFRNFGEDCYRLLRDKCVIRIEEIDASTTSFCVREIHYRDLDDVTQIINRELKRHYFNQSAKLTNLSAM